MRYATELHALSDASMDAGRRLAGLTRSIVRLLQAPASLVDLAVRLVVAHVFFKAGLTKVGSWDTTLALFEYEYDVPILSPELAAVLGTGIELVVPVLLVLGLGSRFAALMLFVFNIVAVISYPDLGAAGLRDHQMWGLLLLVTMTHGPGALSLDRLIARRLSAG